MGYSDTEGFGKTEIPTPALNRLAEPGMVAEKSRAVYHNIREFNARVLVAAISQTSI
ncbi:MAG: hypothetical protein ABGZ53_25155 [Fuerstiella sp.]